MQAFLIAQRNEALRTGRPPTMVLPPQIIRTIQGYSDMRPITFSQESSPRVLMSSTDGRRVMAIDNFVVRVWDARGNLLRRISTGAMCVAAAMSADGRVIVTDFGMNSVAIFDDDQVVPVRHPIDLTGVASSIAISADGSRFIVGVDTSEWEDEDRGKILLYTLDTASDTYSAFEWNHGSGETVWNVAISADGTRFAAASGPNGTLPVLRYWHLTPDDELVGTSLTEIGEVAMLAMSPDGMFVAAGNRRQHVILFDIANGTSRAFRSRGLRPLALAFSPDSETLAVSSQNDTISLYNTRTGANQREISLRMDAYALTYSDNGRRFIISTHLGITTISAQSGSPIMIGAVDPNAQ